MTGIATRGLAGRPRFTAARPTRCLVVLHGVPLSDVVVNEATTTARGLGARVVPSPGPGGLVVTSAELDVSLRGGPPAVDALRAALFDLADRRNVDVAVTSPGVSWREKRLVAFDVDSTLVRGEVIDMLAAHAGRAGVVAQITEEAMRGDLDFAVSLRRRVMLLAGLPLSALAEVARDLELTDGARRTVRMLNRLGVRTGAVSGGFSEIVGPLAAGLGMDFATANRLETSGGFLTGRLVGPIIDCAGKAEAVAGAAAAHGVGLEQCVAVGDGANDVDMLRATGLGVAFSANPLVRAAAEATITRPSLDGLLAFMGLVVGDHRDRAGRTHSGHCSTIP